MKSILIFSIALFACRLNAQIIPDEVWDAFQERYEISTEKMRAFKTDSARESIYSRINTMMRFNDPDYYIAPIAYWNNNLEPPRQELRDEEGAKGVVLEMRLAQRFTIAPWYARRSFWKTTRFTINFDFLYRVARHPLHSNDSPGLPLNTKLGFTLFEHGFPLSLRDNLRKKSKPGDGAISVLDMGYGLINSKNLLVLTPKVDFMHYSNGQRDYARSVVPGYPTRNNYASGNFSTNYLQFKVDLSTINSNTALLNTYVGYQFDFALGGLLSFDSTQEQRYGKQRFLFGVGFHSGPLKTPYKFLNLSDKIYKDSMQYYKATKSDLKDSLSREQYKVERKKMDKPHKLIPSVFELAGRIQAEYITAEIDRFNSHRLGVTWQLCLIPRFSTTWSFMYQGFFGRDYLNIRYDIPVVNHMIAITFNFNRYNSSDFSLLQKAKRQILIEKK